ncbi:MAG: hypothetical protein MMC33_001082 [Icmadophila ericetorum]|nr:hypothetical protein [Icmadophila ericetorum]
MPRRKKFDKSTSTTYSLVFRAQNDPKIHDEASSSRVFQEIAPPQSHKIKNRTDLEKELFGGSDAGSDGSRVRDNEGEAAEYGIYYDDTSYDYMQHMRDLNGGDGNGESFFVEAPAKQKAGKGKAKMSLADALRQENLDDDTRSTASSCTGDSRKQQLLDDDILPSPYLRRTTYQDQQDVPDALAGFQPDMDPRLREVLEALEDEAYVDDEEDIFSELAKDQEELTLEEFEELGVDGDGIYEDEGWESDDTAKPNKEYKDGTSKEVTVDSAKALSEDDRPDHGDGDWMAEFSKFKKADKVSKVKALAASNADLQSSILSTASSMRRKKRKGAKTSTSGYSMTSSSLVRTEGLTLLDARFDKIEEEYAEDGDIGDDEDGGASIVSGTMSTMSTMSRVSRVSSQAPSLTTRKDFDGIMDEFLGNYSMSGKKRVKKGGYQTGMQQLDEIRRELGKPIIGAQKATT